MTTARTSPLATAAPFPGCVPPVPAETGAAQPRLCSHLLELSFPEFAHSLACLLARMGYKDVQLMGVTGGRGRNAYGGFDLQATARHGLTRSLLLAQVKQYRHPVPRSFVDELRGAMLRHGAQQGLLITTSAFSPAARDAAASAQHILPLRLVEGRELAGLLQEHGIPVGHKDPVEATKKRAAPVPAEAMPITPPLSQVPPVLPLAEPTFLPVPGMTVTVTVKLPEPPTEESFRPRQR